MASNVSYPNTGSKYYSSFHHYNVHPSPVVNSIKSEAAKTSGEIQDLKNSRVTPSTTTTNGQPLTHYHSLLYSLLSWEQPRATAVSYASVITFIFAARYLPLLRWAFKLLYVSLGLTASVEIIGQVLFKQGITSSFRPRRYYTVPKETHEALLEDFSQLADFFLIEFQRILFAENVIHTVAAFSATFLAYLLIRFVPLWGLSVIAVTTAYIGPLVYISNREIIDEHIVQLQELAGAQASQLKDLAGERTSAATGFVKQYVDDYSHKAQEYIGRRSASPEMTKAPQTSAQPFAQTIAKPVEPVAEPVIKTEDFPEAPKIEPIVQSIEEPTVSHETEREPLLAA